MHWKTFQLYGLFLFVCWFFFFLFHDIHFSFIIQTHLTFSPEYTSAIERKQVAQQDAERSKFLVDKAKQEALAAMIRAEGESEAARLITSATGPAFIELRRLEAAKEIADTLAASPNVSYLPGNTQMLLNVGHKV